MMFGVERTAVVAEADPVDIGDPDLSALLRRARSIIGRGLLTRDEMRVITQFNKLALLKSAAAKAATFGRRGLWPAPEPGTQPESVIAAKRGRHSEKPTAVAEMIERLWPDAAKIELFARAARAGWDGWGNQVSGIRSQGSGILDASHPHGARQAQDEGRW